jgi:ribosomal protein S18 acetylase RimI-like enzyme
MPVVRVTRTYLEMRNPAELRPAEAPDPTVSARKESCSAAEYRDLYALVGRAFHWRERDAWADERLGDHLAQSHVGVWVLRVSGERAGYFELLRHHDESVEISYFGLAASYFGQGLGKFLLTRAVEEAWNLKATRIWLHTCTLDHAAALPNYVARGFRPYLTETYTVELPDDTRQPTDDRSR